MHALPARPAPVAEAFERDVPVARLRAFVNGNDAHYGPNSETSRVRWESESVSDVSMFQVNITFVFEVFACCPPGPPLPEKRQRSSLQE